MTNRERAEETFILIRSLGRMDASMIPVIERALGAVTAEAGQIASQGRELEVLRKKLAATEDERARMYNAHAEAASSLTGVRYDLREMTAIRDRCNDKITELNARLAQESAGAAAMRTILSGNLRCVWCELPSDGHHKGCPVPSALASTAGTQLLAEMAALREQVATLTRERDAESKRADGHLDQAVRMTDATTQAEADLATAREERDAARALLSATRERPLVFGEIIITSEQYVSNLLAARREGRKEAFEEAARSAEQGGDGEDIADAIRALA